MKAIQIRKEHLEVGDILIETNKQLMKVVAIEFTAQGKCLFTDLFSQELDKWVACKSKISLEMIPASETYLVIRN